MKLNDTVSNVLNEIAGISELPQGAYSLRVDGKSFGVNSTPGVTIVPKPNASGIDVYIAAELVEERMHIPVVITTPGVQEQVFNDFHIGANANITIVAGCGIHNCGADRSQHDGIHVFHLEKGAKVKYIEKHYGDGDGTGERIMNPDTIIYMQPGSYFEMDTVQIKGIDSTKRLTRAHLADNCTVVIQEKLMTHGTQTAETAFEINLDGSGCSSHVMSRSVARDASKQIFLSKVHGNADCHGHSECDAIIMDKASVIAIPEIAANHVEASLIHEAAIGKIAGEQLTKLMTLGLNEKEAEEQIINGFLR